MNIPISEIEHLREEVKNCHRIIKDLQKKREWVDLTRTQMQGVYFEVLKEYRGGPQMEGQLAFGEALQAKLKEKNNG